ncbi:teneurin-m-like [Uloborus diversus]|uniref:teneurin-m-like n=1 Tax=Uloborus diversus TaxID=327109 RepID=UPI00240A0B73|nr:teneurin-m-like [Uloborus diversus]
MESAPLASNEITDHHPGVGYPHCEEDHINHNADRYHVTYPSSTLPNRSMLRRPLSTNQFAHSHFQLRKSNTRQCSWKCTALTFIFVTIALTAALAFFLILLSPTWQQDANHACPLVEDVDLVVESTKSKVNEKSESSKPSSSSVTSLSPSVLSFTEVGLGRRSEFQVGPYSHWIVQMKQKGPSLVRFNYTLPVGARLGVFGRRNQLPTHTRYNFLEILTTDSAKTLRNEKRLYIAEFIQFLERGLWYISAYNDGDQMLDISFITQTTDESSLTCPYDCHGHGRCVMGNCVCNSDFAGDSCAYRICPVLCSNRGEYIGGECVCSPGWKGKECQLREYECEKLDCSGHGECLEGVCRCFPGYKGPHCETVDCLDPDCSDHGVCVSGLCVCRKGWKGNDCSDPDTDALRCLPDCSGHGQFDLELQKCICDEQWTGTDCSQEKCDLDCGFQGHCENGQCLCFDGWAGAKCDEKLCDPRCKDNGQCRNGTCLCIQGWNGKHCTLEGCPKNCNNHGECITGEDDEWVCFCEQHWEGPDCSVPLERKCDDNADNDNDGLVDCADSECCMSGKCENHSLCQNAADPLDILLRKQPPAITASFFERMQFLIEEESLRNGSPRKVAINGSMFWNRYKKSRTSVIRGQVVGASGSGIVGVRVGIDPNTKTGSTLTQETGWFDLLVNGGGAVKLHLQREPFLVQTITVMVPWNEIVVVDKIIFQLHEKKKQSATDETKSAVCVDHDYDTMKPVVLATWKHGFQGGCPERNSVLAESQVIQESLPIPGTDLHLVYHSSRAGGYLSTIQLQLTPDTVPKDLKLIHLRIAIEGILFEKQFEADPAVKYTYAWNRRNVYRQKVYGVATATVYVGYEYNSCSKIIWEVQTTQVSGHDMSVSDIGGWNLDIHHKYNFHEGILQKGDGNNIYLKNKPKLLLTKMGDGQQRPLQCQRCNGEAKTQRLLAPVALASGPDGTIYVGDFNLIRKITTDGLVSTIVELSPAQVSYSYHLTVGPVDGLLYVSDPEQHQILRTLSMLDSANPKNNTEAVVGNGEKCLPRDKDQCGDGRHAKDSRLAYPKGIAITKNGELYIADGTNVRFVDTHGIIHTLIGDYFHKSWRPIPCYATLSLAQVNLRWPTELSINPLDGSLHILDDHLVLRVTPDNRLKVIAGRSLQCPSQSGNNRDKSDLATDVYLESPQGIAFAPNGDLYIAESDSQTVNRVRVVGSDGRVISRFAGSESKCSCLEESCSCFDEEHVLAATTKLSTISAIAVSPDGLLHICDQGNLRIRSVTASLPRLNELSEYEIHSPESQEIYVFNRHGQHVATRNTISGKDVYTFSYNVNTSFGKLSTVTDAAGNKIYILRDYNNQVNTIENTQGGKCRLEMSRMMMLQSFTTPSNFKTVFDYHGSTGLLRSKEDSTGRSYIYNFDEYGRLTESVTPSGQVIRLTYNLSLKGASVTITRDDKDPVSLLIKGSDVTTKIGSTEERITQHPDGSLSVIQRDSSKVDVETVPNPVLSSSSPVSGEMFPVPSRMRMAFSDDNVQYLEWHYFVHADGKDGNRRITRVGRKFKRNGELIFSVVFDREQNSEIIYDRHQVPLVTATYDVMARSVQWQSPQNITPVKVEFDQFGRLTKWERGQLTRNYDFDMQGRLVEIRHSDSNGIMYKYDKKVVDMPSELILPSGSRYLLQYDTAGGLHTIITPNGHKHEVAMQTSLGFYKLLYLSPGVKYPFVMHFNDYGQLLSKMYPDNNGRVVYSYDSSGRLKTEFCGNERTDFAYLEHKTLMRSWTKNLLDLEMRSEFRYHGILVREERLRFSAQSKLNSVKYRYRYEGQVTVVEIEAAGKIVADARYRYTGQSGALEQVQQFLVHRPKVHNVFIQDEQRHFSKTIGLDAYGFISLLAVTLWNREVFSLSIHYDNRGRIRQTQSKAEQDVGTETVEYTYTPDGFLGEVQGRRRFRYLYDVNGNMNSYWNGERQITLRYDDGDRLVGYNDNVPYVIDSRGFIVSRGNEKLTFNAKSQLINAFHPGLYDITYTYDALDRLIAWSNTESNVTQFLYANPKDLKMVTHVHLPNSRTTMSLFYDTNGHLMYIEDTTQNKFFVACDHVGSPVVVFDSEGKVVKKIIRSPFGEIISDSNPQFLIYLDFWGSIRDPYTRLLFFNGRAYQPDVGQWLTPKWEDVSRVLHAPYNIHMYRFKNNDPLSPGTEDDLMIGLPKWLLSFGYSMEHYLRSPFSGQNLLLPRASMRQSLPVISGLSCTAEVVTKHFARLSASPLSDTKYQAELQAQFANLPSVLGDGLLMSTNQGRAIVHVLSDASPILRDVMTEVLNDTSYVDVRFSLNGQDSFYLVQPDQKRVQEDWDQLQRLGTMFNVTMHAGDTHVDLRLRSPALLLNIRYGGSPEEERKRLVRHARRKAVDDAWLMEADLLRKGQRGSRTWSPEEKRELTEKGHVSGYRGASVHDTDVFPELADDPTAVAFHKASAAYGAV